MIVTRSWTTIHPIAARPWRLSISPRSTRILSTTSVELMAIADPMTTASTGDSPSRMTTAAPATAVITIWAMAPGTAIRHTRRSSWSENSTPRANSSSTTPSSASCPICSWSPTNPGVNGPMTTPAAR